MRTLLAHDYTMWRAQARALLSAHVTPLDVTWAEEIQPSLFGADILTQSSGTTLSVPASFFTLAETIACHCDIRRWDLLYQLAFRLTHGEKNLMHIATDPLVHALDIMRKSIRRDAHKAKAFVRFREVKEEGKTHFIAWHEPDHRILPLVGPFFSRRFSDMQWTILTPHASAHWNGYALKYGPGADRSDAPAADQLEDLWRDFYRAIFNPARIKIKTMKREMPVRHWKNLPETEIIADMLAEAPARVQAMLQHSEGSLRSAADFIPPEYDIETLRVAARGCEGCELHLAAHQTVFGVGPANAKLMIVGEQPGDEEDKQGKPFIGPAGQVLDEALVAAGLQRSDIYITNAVKHFRFLYKDSFRQHQSPSRYHVQACKPWLTAEIMSIKPALVVCLGNTAARSLIQPNFMMKNGRGQLVAGAPPMIATYHPSSILRQPAHLRESHRQDFMTDIEAIASWLKTNS